MTGVTLIVESAESAPMQCICTHMRWRNYCTASATWSATTQS